MYNNIRKITRLFEKIKNYMCLPNIEIFNKIALHSETLDLKYELYNTLERI